MLAPFLQLLEHPGSWNEKEQCLPLNGFNHSWDPQRLLCVGRDLWPPEFTSGTIHQDHIAYSYIYIYIWSVSTYIKLQGETSATISLPPLAQLAACALRWSIGALLHGPRECRDRWVPWIKEDNIKTLSRLYLGSKGSKFSTSSVHGWWDEDFTVFTATANLSFCTPDEQRHEPAREELIWHSCKVRASETPRRCAKASEKLCDNCANGIRCGNFRKEKMQVNRLRHESNPKIKIKKFQFAKAKTLCAFAVRKDGLTGLPSQGRASGCSAQMILRQASVSRVEMADANNQPEHLRPSWKVVSWAAARGLGADQGQILVVAVTQTHLVYPGGMHYMKILARAWDYCWDLSMDSCFYCSASMNGVLQPLQQVCLVVSQADAGGALTIASTKNAYVISNQKGAVSKPLLVWLLHWVIPAGKKWWFFFTQQWKSLFASH